MNVDIIRFLLISELNFTFFIITIQEHKIKKEGTTPIGHDTDTIISEKGTVCSER